MDKIIIVRTSSLGDIIQTFPALSYLRQKFPQAQIDWVVEKSFAPLVEAHPDVSGVIVLDTKNWRKNPFSKPALQGMKEFYQALRREKYDVAFDLQGNLKSGMIMTLISTQEKVGFGWKSVHEKPNLLFTRCHIDTPKGVNIRDDYLLVVKGFFKDVQPVKCEPLQLKLPVNQRENLAKMTLSFPKKPLVLVCPGSAWPNKQLTKETLIDFLQKLQVELQCHFLLAWGTEDEKKLAEDVQRMLWGHSLVLEKLPLPVLQNLMRHMQLVVAMDSLPLHLAGTTSCPTFSVFGASLASKFKPSGRQHMSLQGVCPYHRTFEKRCPILRTCATGACIRSLNGEEVFVSFKQQWHDLKAN
jgi:heptosyltransferase-1